MAMVNATITVSSMDAHNKRIRKRPRVPTPSRTRRRQEPWLLRLVCYAAVTSTFLMVRGESGSNPNHNSLQQPTVTPPLIWTTETPVYYDITHDDDDSDDGEGGESSSSSEDDYYESWLPLGYASSSSTNQPQPPPPSNPIPPTKPKPSTKKSNQNPKKSSPSAQMPPLQSQSLKTLEKLRQMLDETDYMTTRPEDHQQHGSEQEEDSESAKAYNDTDDNEQKPQHQQPQPSQKGQQQRLWTSADRSKYKRQQQRLKQQQQHHQQHSSDDDELSDTDDGLDYTLPNLPIYLSDAEAESDVEDDAVQGGPNSNVPPPPPPPPPMPWAQQHQQYQVPPQTQAQQQQQEQPPQYPLPQQQYYNTGMPPYPPHQMQQQQQPYHQGMSSPPNNAYPPYAYPPPYNNMGPYPQHQAQLPHQQQLQQQLYAQHFAAWAAAMGYAPPPPQSMAMAPPKSLARPPVPMAAKSSAKGMGRNINPNAKSSPKTKNDGVKSTTAGTAKPNFIPPPPPPTTTIIQSDNTEQSYDVTIAVPPAAQSSSNRRSWSEMASQISFDSVQKLALMTVTATMACYVAVSPRSLPQVEYNRRFYDNVKLAAMVLIGPAITSMSVMDASENDLNDIIQSLYVSFSLGYLLVFGLEIISTTLVRLSVFLFLEEDIFSLLLPRIPVVVLPWVLRENRYRPKRITLLAADFLTSCVACPILEEYIKLKLLQWTTRLPKNYAWTKKSKSTAGGGTSSKKKKQRKREKIVPMPGEKEVTCVNKYVAQMLAVSIGLKLADAGRRVLMYTKDHHADKSLYAICRGLFPIQELCGAMTALRLAKRDVLGAEMSTWWILAPAVVVHGMANFRGMKPIFKWNSSTPWSEMQLSPWSAAGPATLPQLASKGFSKFMWLVVIMRVLGYCVKNYYYTNRQAEKRTTTYAGNPCAIDAALASSDYLKKTHGK